MKKEVEALINKGADVNAQVNGDTSSLDPAKVRRHLTEASSEGKGEGSM